MGTVTIACATGLACSRVPDLSPDPHALVAESAIRNRAHLAPCDSDVAEWWQIFGDIRLGARTVVIGGVTMGELAAHYARHGGGSRFRDIGATTLDELRALSAGDLDDAWQDARGARDDGDLSWIPSSRTPGVDPAGNPVASFLLYHVTALRLAAEARVSDETDASWTLALAYEASALSYLLDAMSSDRMSTPRTRGPFSLLSRNRAASEAYFGGSGLFVLNSDGELWQAFGRGHLEWFRTHLCHVMDASQRAVREIELVFFVRNGRELPEHLRTVIRADHAQRSSDEIVDAWLTTRPGPEWLEVERLPSLRAIPSPIWATWRKKHGEPDADGIRPATHFAQVETDSLHDPTIGSGTPPFGDPDGKWHAFLGRSDLRDAASIPTWRSPREVLGHDRPEPITALRTDPDLSSVRFVQHRSVPPSLGGLFVSAALLGARESRDASFTAAAGAGYLRRWVVVGASLWAGLDAEYRFPSDAGGGKEIATSLVLGYSSNLFRPGGWIEIGPLWDLESAHRHGVAVKAAWLPGTLRLPFLYAGVTPRLEAAVGRTDETRLQLGVALLLH